MKKKIILTLVLSTIALLILCAAALAEVPCSFCEAKGETGVFVTTQIHEFTCDFECNNCDAFGSTIHEHGIPCAYCGKSFACQFRYYDNGDGTHTYRCIWNSEAGCPDKTETVSDCTGGEATCVRPGYCVQCRAPYLPADESKHKFDKWHSNGDGTHTIRCSNSGCTKLGSETENCSGIEATCSSSAYCVTCESYYGTPDETKHAWDEKWSSLGDNEHHVKYCANHAEHVLKEKCSGGIATCLKPAVCKDCGGNYGDVSTTNHGEYTPWTTINAEQHVRYCNDCAHPETYEYENHTGGTATCTDFPICDVCKGEYGELDFDNHDLESTRVEGTETHITVCLNGCGYENIEECSGGKATCLKRAVCAGCGEEYGELPSDSGHSYKKKTVAGTCTSKGYIKYECKYCGDSYTEQAKTANLHWFDLWTANGDGTHSAPCKREGCDHTGKTECASYEVTIGETTFSVCPVCGSANFAAIEGAEITGENLPIGEEVILGAEKPFDGALYAFTAAYEYSGKVEEFIEAVTVSLPVAIEGEFRLLRADEAQTEIPFTMEEGVLTFETETAGLCIIVPAAEEV